jgi:FtsZ-binding cell division protein ZapB
LAGLFVESIKELRKENNELKAQLATLQDRLTTLENKIVV